MICITKISLGLAGSFICNSVKIAFRLVETLMKPIVSGSTSKIPSRTARTSVDDTEMKTHFLPL